jgi:hypothetical protein
MRSSASDLASVSLTGIVAGNSREPQPDGGWNAQKGGSWVDNQSCITHLAGGISMSVVWGHSIVSGDWYPWFPEVIKPATDHDWGTTDLFPAFGMPALS